MNGATRANCTTVKSVSMRKYSATEVIGCLAATAMVVNDHECRKKQPRTECAADPHAAPARYQTPRIGPGEYQTLYEHRAKPERDDWGRPVDIQSCVDVVKRHKVPDKARDEGRHDIGEHGERVGFLRGLASQSRASWFGFMLRAGRYFEPDVRCDACKAAIVSSDTRPLPIIAVFSSYSSPGWGLRPAIHLSSAHLPGPQVITPSAIAAQVK